MLLGIHADERAKMLAEVREERAIANLLVAELVQVLLDHVQEGGPLRRVPLQDFPHHGEAHLPHAADGGCDDAVEVPLRQHRQLPEHRAVDEGAEVRYGSRAPPVHDALGLLNDACGPHPEDVHRFALVCLPDNAVAGHVNPHLRFRFQRFDELRGGSREDAPISEDLDVLGGPGSLARDRVQQLGPFLWQLLERPGDDAAVEHAHVAGLPCLQQFGAAEYVAEDDLALRDLFGRVLACLAPQCSNAVIWEHLDASAVEPAEAQVLRHAPRDVLVLVVQGHPLARAEDPLLHVGEQEPPELREAREGVPKQAHVPHL
mmetsp:Transcript_120942/g.328187  ORF Transcript_120942/g.328187 Transcript_120942/m.328187 type:complete len:317 (-) Transcript_120942:110-1060(-)